MFFFSSILFYYILLYSSILLLYAIILVILALFFFFCFILKLDVIPVIVHLYSTLFLLLLVKFRYTVQCIFFPSFNQVSTLLIVMMDVKLTKQDILVFDVTKKNTIKP